MLELCSFSHYFNCSSQKSLHKAIGFRHHRIKLILSWSASPATEQYSMSATSLNNTTIKQQQPNFSSNGQTSQFSQQTSSQSGSNIRGPVYVVSTKTLVRTQTRSVQEITYTYSDGSTKVETRYFYIRISGVFLIKWIGKQDEYQNYLYSYSLLSVWW